MRILTNVILVASTAAAQSAPATIEFGSIAWQRDFATARVSAAKQQQPMLLLFQEVPG